jgi:MoxR-like ATPase
MAKVLQLDFRRIQFTPDLLPADLIGTMIYKPKIGDYEVKKGPIFSNIILADEVNRSPAKVQSALLEAMQEKQVTIGDQTYYLDKPFVVLATQNPVEQEGTYPLPEAQIDRFMMKVYVDYLDKHEELEVMRRMSNMNFDYQIERYIIELVFATRRPLEYGLRDEARYIQFGVSPRATIYLNRAAKALAYLEGRDYVLPEDIKELAPDIMNHRILLNYEAEADGVKTTTIIDSILRKVAIG